MAVNEVIRNDRASVFVNVAQGESLVFRVTAQGAAPRFELLDSGGQKLLTEQDSPTSPGVWERRWVPTAPKCTLGLMFLSAIKYTYQVEHHSGGPTATLIDRDYQAQQHELTVFHGLDII